MRLVALVVQILTSVRFTLLLGFVMLLFLGLEGPRTGLDRELDVVGAVFQERQSIVQRRQAYPFALPRRCSDV